MSSALIQAETDDMREALLDIIHLVEGGATVRHYPLRYEPGKFAAYFLLR